MHSNGRSAQKLAELKEACRRHGVPLTVQRSVILEALAARDDHPTADQILDDVRGRLPGLSRTTVYRVLDALTRIGLAVKTCSPGTAVRFDPRTERHHHLVCLECERVLDLHDPAFDVLPMPSARRHGFELTDYSVHFRGLCPDCRRARSAAAPARPRGRDGARARKGRRSDVTR
ncbi:MAG TPA: Fur family transcriptional regulator [Candidatus Binatia bacterium]|nr:Fur family transcriptional regulator [Candidatus Binatia bacterium]